MVLNEKTLLLFKGNTQKSEIGDEGPVDFEKAITLAGNYYIITSPPSLLNFSNYY